MDFQKKLMDLKARRQGDKGSAFVEEARFMNMRDTNIREAYENIQESESVKYAVGAMSAVDKKATEISIREGNRVADALINSLANSGINAIKRFQGSVPLDIHIKGHSDVDMLVILNDIILVKTPKLDGSECTSWDSRPMEVLLQELRYESEESLPKQFPEVEIDMSGRKSIAMEGGSLKRKVDVVPSCWYDNYDYQRSSEESDRGIMIYDKSSHTLVENSPFLHIKKINDKDKKYEGNLKKVVRLLKNTIADMDDEKKVVTKKLSSYDIAALAYHMNDRLKMPKQFPLGLVEQSRNYLSVILNNKDLRDYMPTPDGSRKVFNSEEKVTALLYLEREMNDLAISIFRELSPYASEYMASSLEKKLVRDLVYNF